MLIYLKGGDLSNESSICFTHIVSEDGRRQDDPIHLRQGKPARQLRNRRACEEIRV